VHADATCTVNGAPRTTAVNLAVDVAITALAEQFVSERFFIAHKERKMADIFPHPSEVVVNHRISFLMPHGTTDSIVIISRKTGKALWIKRGDKWNCADCKHEANEHAESLYPKLFEHLDWVVAQASFSDKLSIDPEAIEVEPRAGEVQEVD
jgi:hypothetical protein